MKPAPAGPRKAAPVQEPLLEELQEELIEEGTEEHVEEGTEEHVEEGTEEVIEEEYVEEGTEEVVEDEFEEEVPPAPAPRRGPPVQAARAAAPAPRVASRPVPAAPPAPAAKKKGPIPAQLAPHLQKGAAALAEWRAARQAAIDGGEETWAAWQAEQAEKKAKKTLTPIRAIRNFCLHCTGGVRVDITHCSATECPLHVFRPFQPGTAEEHEAA
jgi:hypothetical protein